MYIYKTIILTIIFLVIIYIFLFRRAKKQRKSDFDSVKEYHETYLNHKSSLSTNYQYRIKSNKPNSYMHLSGDSYSSRSPMVTRFNSNEDYREVNSSSDLSKFI